MEPIFFKSSAEFRAWLNDNHQEKFELLVGYYKKASGKPSMTWPESVDEALCFGWIDGIRRSIDDERYSIRFTPRKPTSIWSKANIKKVDELTRKNLMRPSGIAAFQKRSESKSGIYSFENAPKSFTAEFEKLFSSERDAWIFFNEQPPGYKKLSIDHIMSAKQEKTQLARLEKLISASKEGKRL